MSEEQADDATGVAQLSQGARFQLDLALYLRAAHVPHGLPLTSRGYVTRPALRRARVALRAIQREGISDETRGDDAPEREDRRLFFLRRLAQRLGLLIPMAGETQAQRLCAAPQDVLAVYFARDLADRLRLCARVWLAGGWWRDDPTEDEPLAGLMAPASPRIALARRRLLETLATSSAGTRLAIPPARVDPTSGAQRSRSARGPVRGAAADDEATRAALLGPLTWLGCVRHDPARPNHCIVDCACLALSSSSGGTLAERHGAVIVQPDLSIVAYPPLTAPLLVALDLYAEPIQLDVAARYRLSRAAMARSGRSALGAAAIAERLERLTGAPLPENVRAALRDWSRSGERLSLTEDADVLEVDDPALLDALLADRATDGWIARRMSATCALLAAGRVDAVRAWLLRHGELPATIALKRDEPDTVDDADDLASESPSP